ncbi:MAG TPA: SEC-C metal-binding domain-containing protein [Bacteroidales bacterium]|jgi:hypothetical protein|nr:hypothetical protein [Bacteroidales bacterium]OQC59069.1 MAG: hypothetical protein BWX51_01739 [Bacteroidetes bacterium ADurb.Bin012]NLZ09323.1 hypothetical protein [Bacteroidales bacterium]HNR27203.1 SEC-C metal-binding domain-containing protein [Bacteroidales bacterium]HNT47326.1 SEC-C metal-binding domain-containing protein [Bacteroidales bacterium]
MIYQILIVLDKITPEIWRRVLVHEDMLLFDFHIVIQKTMGWENCHLHHFIKDGKYYSERMENDNFWDDELNIEYSAMAVGDLLKKEGDTIIYEYDFGDSWIHTLTLEAILDPANTTTQIPSCIAGQMACPQEDSGGPFLYKPSRGKGKTAIDLDAINSLLREDDSDEAKEDDSDESKTEVTYKDILLKTMTKAQIIEVARSYQMKIKTSANKEICATFIEQELQQNPSLMRNALSYNELKALYVLFKGVQDSRQPEEDSSYSFTFEDLEGLLLVGLLDISFDHKTGAPKFQLPDNMKKHLLPELQSSIEDQALKKAYHIESLFLGMLTFYGVLPLKKIEELFSHFLPEALPLTNLLDYFKSNRLCREYNAAYSDKHLLCFYYKGIPDAKPLIAEIEKRKDLEYATFKEDELLQASKRVYFYENTYSQRLLRQLSKFDIPDIDFFMHEIWVNTQIETSLHSLLELISQKIVFDKVQDLQEILKYLMDYQNNIPRWTLKGNVPGDLHKSSTKGGNPTIFRQPGRNDPCPCGSGKKFKHCCGNN